MSEIKIEFAVQMEGEKCADKVREVLKGMGESEIDSKQGRVIIHTQEAWFIIKETIEETGSTTVLNGFGGQPADKPGLVVDGVVDGLSTGLHGLHIHETGDVSAGCASVGDHYNPRGSPYGGPDDDSDNRHAEDLGNIRGDGSGPATFRFMDNILEVWEIIGRSVVIAQNPDDLGRGRNKQSQIDGNSGERIACDIIARSAGILQNFNKICACDGVTLWDERYKPLAGGTRVQKF